MFGLSYQELVDLSGYVKFFMILFIFVVFYSYAYSIYKRDKTGDRDFEKYSKLVLDDNIDSTPLEPIREEDSKTDKEK